MLKNGLYGQNLTRLKQHCVDNLTKNRILYYILGRVFKEIQDEFNDQGISSAQYDLLNEKLLPKINKVIDYKNDPSLYQQLEELIITAQELHFLMIF